MKARRPTRSEEESYRRPFFLLSVLLLGATLWLLTQELETRRPWKRHQRNWALIERARAEKNLRSERLWLEEGTVNGAEGPTRVGERVRSLESKIRALEDRLIGGAFDSSAPRAGVSGERDELRRSLQALESELSSLRAGVELAEGALQIAEARRPALAQFWNPAVDLVDRCHSCHVAFDSCGFSSPEEILAHAVASDAGKEALRDRYCLTREEARAYEEAKDEIMEARDEGKEMGFRDVEPSLFASSPGDEPLRAQARILGLPSAEAEALYRTHPGSRELFARHPPERFGCTSCHFGQGRQTKIAGNNALADLFLGRDEASAEFDHGRGDPHWAPQLLDAREGGTEASCFRCHFELHELEGAPLLNRGKKLALELGCVGCHAIAHLSFDRKTGPPLHDAASRLDRDWLFAWISRPRSIRPRTRMPNFWPNAVSKDGSIDRDRSDCAAFDFELGGPRTPPVPSNCFEQRETEVAYIVSYLSSVAPAPEGLPIPGTADAGRGRALFDGVGCKACHDAGEWRGGSVLPGAEARDFAPALDGIGDALADPMWLFRWLRDPRALWPGARMPSLRLSEAEAWDLVAHLSSLSSKKPEAPSEVGLRALEDPEGPKKGRSLITYYGCPGCHEIPGFEGASRIGEDLSSFGAKAVDRLDFGRWPGHGASSGERSWTSWVDTKLRTPRAFDYERATGRMPSFDLSEPEVEALMVFLRAQVPATPVELSNLGPRLDDERRAAERGALLVERLNCRGCHQIDGRGLDVNGDALPDGGDIAEAFRDAEDVGRAPPKLVRVGAKLEPDWLFGFLLEPRPLRRNLQIRMPSFGFSEDEARDVVAYFVHGAGRSLRLPRKATRDPVTEEERSEGKRLFQVAQCAKCHPTEGESTGNDGTAPDLSQARSRLQWDWLFEWLVDPQAQLPGTSMPSFFLPADDGSGEYTTPIADIAGGDWRKQVALLRAYVVDLGRKPSSKEAR